MGRLTEYTNINGDPAIYCVGKKVPYWKWLYQPLKKLAHYKDLEEQGRLITLPYEWGQFVKPKDNSVGTINAYTVVRDGVLAWVSGYKDSWCGEYLLEEIKPLTKEEIEAKLEELNPLPITHGDHGALSKKEALAKLKELKGE